MIVARHYVVTGRVQRVGFRLFVQDAARREAVSGEVCNRHDGGVEVDAEGDLEAILRFELALRRGPAGARVDDLETTENVPTHRYRSFSIRG